MSNSITRQILPKILITALLGAVAVPQLAAAQELERARDSSDIAPLDGAYIRPADQGRLAALDEVFGYYFANAIARADRADLDRLIDAMRGGGTFPQNEAVLLAPGDWHCQMVKMSLDLPVLIYDPFRCRGEPDGSFNKVTGSQRFIGAVHESTGDRPLFLGTGYVTGAEPPPYESLGDYDPEGTSAGQIWPMAGLLTMTDADRGYIIMPSPYLDSGLDILLISRE